LCALRVRVRARVFFSVSRAVVQPVRVLVRPRAFGACGFIGFQPRASKRVNIGMHRAVGACGERGSMTAVFSNAASIHTHTHTHTHAHAHARTHARAHTHARTGATLCRVGRTDGAAQPAAERSARRPALRGAPGARAGVLLGVASVAGVAFAWAIMVFEVLQVLQVCCWVIMRSEAHLGRVQVGPVSN
jgi:hypothetical protein